MTIKFYDNDWRILFQHDCNGEEINESMPQILYCRCYQPTQVFLAIQDRWAVELSKPKDI